MNPSVTPLFERAKTWRAEISALREILLETELSEEHKWYQPCYTLSGKNVAIIGRLKDCCVLSFFKGALLTDDKGVLEMPGPNSQSARVIRFRGIEDVNRLAPIIRVLIQQAIELEQSGRKVALKSINDREIPVELEHAFTTHKGLREAFEALTPGRQRGYLLHFSSAKQSSTRVARIERAISIIHEGRGYNER